MALVALAGVSFAVQSILAKTAYARGADVPTVLAVRFAVATAAVWGVTWLARRRGAAVPPPLPTRRRLGLGLLGLLFVTNALFAYLALDRLPAGTATLLIYVFPALVALWSRLFFGERLTRAKVAALALALVGCALTVDPDAALGAGAGLSWVGVGWAFGSALSNSWYATLAGPLGRGVPELAAAAASLPVTAACFAAYLIARLIRGDPAPDVTAVGWLACIGIGLLAGLAIAVFLAGVARICPSRAAIVLTSEPAAAVALGALLLGEAVAAVTLLGGLFIVAAIVTLARATDP